MGARGGRSWRKPAPHQDRFLCKLHGPQGRKAKRTAIEDRPKSEKNNGACQRAPTTAPQVTTEKKGNSRHRRCTPLRYADISAPWKTLSRSERREAVTPSSSPDFRSTS